MAPKDGFARFVSLAVHDLRTPLATVSGFAHTLERTGELGEPAGRYVEMIQAASEQMSELLELLGLVVRIERGRYEPAIAGTDTLELARAAGESLGEKAAVTGSGGEVRVDREGVQRALAALALCALRHGALERVELVVDGPVVAIGPVTPETGPIILGEDLKDLGAAAARRLVEALGGSLSLEGDRLLVLLPT